MGEGDLSLQFSRGDEEIAELFTDIGVKRHAARVLVFAPPPVTRFYESVAPLGEHVPPSAPPLPLLVPAVLIVVRSLFRRYISPRSVMAIDGNNLTLPAGSSLRSSSRPVGQLIALIKWVFSSTLREPGLPDTRRKSADTCCNLGFSGPLGPLYFMDNPPRTFYSLQRYASMRVGPK